jgi:hypothetical protein
LPGAGGVQNSGSQFLAHFKRNCLRALAWKPFFGKHNELTTDFLVQNPYAEVVDCICENVAEFIGNALVKRPKVKHMTKPKLSKFNAVLPMLQ